MDPISIFLINEDNVFSTWQSFSRRTLLPEVSAVKEPYARFDAPVFGLNDTEALFYNGGMNVGAAILVDGQPIGHETAGDIRISGVAATNVTKDSADIIWSTSGVGTSKVDYGEDDSYGDSEEDLSLVWQHTVHLSGLEPGTTYHFRVESVSAGGLTVQSADLTFETLQDTVNPAWFGATRTIQPGVTG